MTGQWLIVPGVEDKAELLARQGVPAVWVQTAEPVRVSGLAVPAEQAQRALGLLGLPSFGLESAPTEIENCALLVEPAAPASGSPTRRAYVQLCTLRLARELADAEATLHASAARIEALMVELTRAQSEAATARAKLSHFQQFSRTREAYWAGEFDRLMAHPSVVSVEVFEGGLRVFTTLITIAHAGQRYRIGAFRLDLYVGGKVVVSNLQNPGADLAYDHPHVRKGSPCLGTIAGPVAKLIGEHEFVTAAFLLLEFLETYNPDSAYCSVMNWGR